MQRDRATGRAIGPIALLAELDEQLMIEQPPPQHDLLPGRIGIHFVVSPLNRDSPIATDLAPLGLTGKGTEPLPGAHLPDTVGGQPVKPVLQAAVRFVSVGFLVVAVDEVAEPGVRLGLRLRAMEMVQCLVGLLDGSEGPFDLAFGASSRPPSILPGRHVGRDCHARSVHHGPEHTAASDRPVVRIKVFRNAL